MADKERDMIDFKRSPKADGNVISIKIKHPIGVTCPGCGTSMVNTEDGKVFCDAYGVCGIAGVLFKCPTIDLDLVQVSPGWLVHQNADKTAP